MIQEQAKLSIVVGTYNRRDQIQRMVESVQRETSIPYILYITDAGSTDGTIEYLETIRSDVIRPLLVGKLLGQARAYNDVFEQVTTPYVCWLSDDNEVVNHGLDVAVAILKRDARIGMVALKTRDKVGPFVSAPYIGGLSDIGVLNVNQGVLKTEVLNRVGRFSETFKDYGIDPDLTAKVLFSGYDIVYTKPVALHHYRNWSTDKSSPEYKKIKEKNERARHLYSAKYGQFVRPSLTLRLKHKVRNFLKGRPSRANGQEKAIASSNLARDWTNILGGRYISLFDVLLHYEKPYHLRQRCPRHQLPTELPADPQG
jgi:GT2 family glycosyltransferase